ncbi:hypothetical protein UA32_11705 [Photobacterium angustum]|uniref:TraK protein n=1 Tax=Photobacterium angustum TaxID=661 RepID=A0ABX5H166_PHOAN|nr:hypothetical protein [Photobacterium angustum]KJG37628.1 hypothetical protein UA32_11705 [Photobacterium angustum]PSX07082.1 hypothetical protein C0W27_16055 [Photobacterium angustum]
MNIKTIIKVISVFPLLLTAKVAAEEKDNIYLPSMLSEPLKKGNEAKREISEAEYAALDEYIDKVAEEKLPLGSAALENSDLPVVDQKGRLLEISSTIVSPDDVSDERVKEVVGIPKVASIRETEGGINPYPDYGIVDDIKADSSHLDQSPLKSRAREIYSPNPVINAQPSDPITLAVGVGQSNRISFNFESLDIKTSNTDAPILINKGYLYVTPKNPDEPIALLVSERGIPGSAVNVLLLPADVPPIMAKVTVLLDSNLKKQRQELISEYKKREIEAQKELDEINAALERGETDLLTGSDPYQERITKLLVEVAKENIPTGFSLKNYNEVSKFDRYPCDNSKMVMMHETVMQLESSREIIDIVKVTNDINGLRSVEEEYCIEEGVMAAAVYNKSLLSPGESTELYILRDKNYQKKLKKQQSRKRPSLRN